MPDLTDAEVICWFMEPMPCGLDASQNWCTRWWILRRDNQWHPQPLDLDALREVEQELRELYGMAIHSAYLALPEITWHLTAAQKEAALATVIRGIK